MCQNIAELPLPSGGRGTGEGVLLSLLLRASFGITKSDTYKDVEISTDPKKSSLRKTGHVSYLQKIYKCMQS